MNRSVICVAMAACWIAMGSVARAQVFYNDRDSRVAVTATGPSFTDADSDELNPSNGGVFNEEASLSPSIEGISGDGFASQNSTFGVDRSSLPNPFDPILVTGGSGEGLARTQAQGVEQLDSPFLEASSTYIIAFEVPVLPTHFTLKGLLDGDSADTFAQARLNQFSLNFDFIGEVRTWSTTASGDVALDEAIDLEVGVYELTVQAFAANRTDGALHQASFNITFAFDQEDNNPPPVIPLPPAAYMALPGVVAIGINAARKRIARSHR